MADIQLHVGIYEETKHGESWRDAFKRAFPDRAAMLKSEIFDDAVIEARKQGWFLAMHIFDGEE